jgi:hypothetical protein
MKRIKYYSLSCCFFLFVSCNIDKWDLEDQSNQLIPNYSLTLNTLECNPSFSTNIFSIDKDNFITAVRSIDNTIKVIKITQTLNTDSWTLNHEIVKNIDGDKLVGFEKINDFYYLTTASAGSYKITKFDKGLNEISSFSSFESYIDTSYNDINGIELSTMAMDTASGIYLGGHLSSFSKEYSCLIKLDEDLNPLYIKTYFENDTIKAILPLSTENFIVVNQNGDKIELISDHTNGKSYQKYDLTLNELFHSAQLIQLNSKLYLAGYVSSGTGKTIEISLGDKNAFIADVKNYEVNGIVVKGSSRNSLLISGVTKKGKERSGFVSEFKDKNYVWCNAYQDKKYVKSLALTQSLKLGLAYLYLVEENGMFFLHLIRTDEEGATLQNPYELNCVQ